MTELLCKSNVEALKTHMVGMKIFADLCKKRSIGKCVYAIVIRELCDQNKKYNHYHKKTPTYTLT